MDGSAAERIEARARFLLALFALGFLLAGAGLEQWRARQGCGQQPVEIAVQELERGFPANPYVRLGPHEAFPEVGYSSSGALYYPILSPQAYAEAERRAGPKPERLQVLKQAKVAVVVWSEHPSTQPLTGMVMNRVYRDALRFYEADLGAVCRSFDPGSALLFKVGEHPLEIWQTVLLLAGGAAVMGLTLGIIVGRSTRLEKAGLLLVCLIGAFGLVMGTIGLLTEGGIHPIRLGRLLLLAGVWALLLSRRSHRTALALLCWGGLLTTVFDWPDDPVEAVEALANSVLLLVGGVATVMGRPSSPAAQLPAE